MAPQIASTRRWWRPTRGLRKTAKTAATQAPPSGGGNNRNNDNLSSINSGNNNRGGHINSNMPPWRTRQAWAQYATHLEWPKAAQTWRKSDNADRNNASDHHETPQQ